MALLEELGALADQGAHFQQEYDKLFSLLVDLKRGTKRIEDVTIQVAGPQGWGWRNPDSVPPSPPAPPVVVVQ